MYVCWCDVLCSTVMLHSTIMQIGIKLTALILSLSLSLFLSLSLSFSLSPPSLSLSLHTLPHFYMDNSALQYICSSFKHLVSDLAPEAMCCMAIICYTQDSVIFSERLVIVGDENWVQSAVESIIKDTTGDLYFVLHGGMSLTKALCISLY